MADERRFPMIPARAWWGLRRRFRSSLPKEVTSTYVASALDMTPKSADANVLPGLRQLGLLTDENKPTDLARRWRDDDEYAAVVEEIRESIYPDELLHLAPPEDLDRARVESWFARHTGGGESAARKMASVYILLCEADPARQPDETPQTASATKPRPAAKKTASGAAKKTGSQAAPPTDTRTEPAPTTPRVTPTPQVVFNIQVVLPTDATAETYDQIFRSISEHLLRGKGE